MGRNHAPCGGAAGADPSYPVANGRLDVQGWDFVSGRLVSPTQTFDLMGYCDPQWVSNFNYRAVQGFMESRPVMASSSIPAPYIMVGGKLANGQLVLNPVSEIEAPADAEIEAGEYLLTLHGDRTVSVPFAMAETAEGDQAHFALAVPPVKGLYAVEVSKAGQLLALKVAGPARPQQRVEVQRVTGGVELSWDATAFPWASIAHVGDEGHTTLSLWQTGGKAFISTEGLDEGGAFEVSLSDGVQSQRLVVAR
jgi:hypothetical protein